jgi:hypothetical protein
VTGLSSSSTSRAAGGGIATREADRRSMSRN